MKNSAYAFFAIAITYCLLMVSCQKEELVHQEPESIPGESEPKCWNWTPSVTPPDVYCGNITTATLYANSSQSIVVGTLIVGNDETDLYLTYTINPGYKLSSIHAHVGDAIPMMYGYPIFWAFNLINPLIFPFPPLTTYSVSIPLDGLGECFFISARAMVRSDPTAGGTGYGGYLAWAYSDCVGSSGGNNCNVSFTGNYCWGWYFDYCKQSCWSCGDPIVDARDGQEYNTVQIGNQCWMAENLNVGSMINITQSPTNNGIIEKYCYDNNPANCDTYGGLYRWDELMGYSTQEGTQGICPPGFHVPTDEEWKILQGTVDSQYGVGDPEWDQTYPILHHGYDVGTNLKTTSGWNFNGNGTDLYGFSGLPGSTADGNQTFGEPIGFRGFWWSSTTESYYGWFAYFRSLGYSWTQIESYYTQKDRGFSVRCVKD